MDMYKSFFAIAFLIYINKYGTPPIVNFMLCNFFNLLNDLYILFLYNDKECVENIEVLNEETNNKYEDKYLDEIRKIKNEWLFTNDEVEMTKTLFTKKYDEIKQEIVNEIEKNETHMKLLLDEIQEIKNTDWLICDTKDDANKMIRLNKIAEEKIEFKIIEIKKDIENLNLLFEDETLLINKTNDELKKNIITNKIEKLANSYTIEKTPIGNVLMVYDSKREAFKYYSDVNIPYRYLEVVARKYVKIFQCKPLLIDMEEELRLFEEKIEKENKEEVIEKDSQNLVVKNSKKNVFAKFKNYNKNIGGNISIASSVPPKNSIPNNRSDTENKKILLKEKSNRYTYDGKLSNFQFIQKVEKKTFNKKLGLSFSEFKKMQKSL